MKKVVILPILFLSAVCGFSQEDPSSQEVSVNRSLETYAIHSDSCAKHTNQSCAVQRNRSRVTSREGKIFHARARRPVPSPCRIRRPIRIGH